MTQGLIRNGNVSQMRYIHAIHGEHTTLCIHIHYAIFTLLYFNRGSSEHVLKLLLNCNQERASITSDSAVSAAILLWVRGRRLKVCTFLVEHFELPLG